MSRENLDSSLKLMVKTSFIVLVGVFLSKLFTYIYRVIIARTFGPEVYGLFSLAVMMAGWFIAISSLGISEGLARYIPVYRAKKQYKNISFIFRFSLGILTLSSLILGAILFLGAELLALEIFHNPALITYFRYAGIVVPITLLCSPFLGSLRSYEYISTHSFIFNIFQTFSKLLLLIFFIILGLNSDSVMLSYILGTLAMLILAFYVSKKKMPEIFVKPSIPKDKGSLIKKELLTYSLPLLFSSFILILFYWIDTFSIGLYKTVAEVGFYNSAVPIAMFLAITPELFSQLLFPLINREYSNKNLVLIRELSKQVTKWIFMINLPVFLLLIIFPGAAINLLFGPQYLPAENALRILALSAFLSSLFLVPTQFLPMLGKSKLVLFNMILGFVLNFFLNSIFVPMKQIWFIENSLGINGAAFATLLSFSFLNLLFTLQSKHYLNFLFFRRKMLNILLACLIPLAALLAIKESLSLNYFSIAMLCLFFFMLYLVFLFVFRCLDKKDWMIIEAVKKKFL